MLLKLEPNNWRDPSSGSRRGFALGCVQWTFGRTKTLVGIYMEVANGRDTITFEQALRAEGLMISREFLGSYSSVYSNWQKANSGSLASVNAAYSAGYIVCTQYEKPADMQTAGVERGNLAKTVYNIMMGY